MNNLFVCKKYTSQDDVLPVHYNGRYSASEGVPTV